LFFKQINDTVSKNAANNPTVKILVFILALLFF